MVFKHPTVLDGVVSCGDQSYPVVGGLVDCPPELGHGLHWAYPGPGDVVPPAAVDDSKKQKAKK